MQKRKVLLVDDEYLALQLLENFITKVPELEVVAKTKSPIEAIDILNQETIDLLFSCGLHAPHNSFELVYWGAGTDLSVGFRLVQKQNFTAHRWDSNPGSYR